MWRRLNDLLHERKREAAWGPGVEVSRILELAAKALKQWNPAAGGIEPLYVREGVLTLRADHPALAQIVRMHERELLTQLNRAGGKIRRVIIRVAPPTAEQQ